MAKETTTAMQQVEGHVRKGYADMNALYGGGLEAMVASNNAMMKGCQEMTSELLSFSQAQIKDGLDVSKRLAAAETFDAATQVQADFVRSWVQAYTDECKKLGVMTESLVKEMFSPLKGQADVVAARISTPTAA